MIIGWREYIALPDLGLARVHAKIDTGARTSSLHAMQIKQFERDGAPWVRFHIPHHSGLRARDCEAPLVDERAVKNTSGTPESRLVISTLLVIGRRRWHIDVTLADRGGMTMPIILGRTAIRRHGILVDPGRSNLVGPPVFSRLRAE
jgi:hypothetical protein